MPDLTELQAAQAVEITDASGTNTVTIKTSLPGVADAGLTVREASQGQAAMANSHPVTISSDQLPFGSLVSTNNSSTTTLTANSVFTGTGEDVSQYSAVLVSIFSDQASAANGASFQWSSNNTNWDVALGHDVIASTSATFEIQAFAKFFRIVYTNGGTNQGSFRLQTIYKFIPGITYTPTNEVVTTANTALTTKSILLGQSGVNYVNVQTDVSGDLMLVGNVAAATTDSGNPVKIGGVAKTALPTAVTDGQRANILTDKLGRLVTQTAQIRELIIKNRVSLANQTETTLLAAAGVGVFVDLANLIVTNTDINNGVVVIDIRDSTGGTIQITMSATGGQSFSIPFNPPFPQTTANNNWTVKCTTTPATAIVVTVIGIKNA